LEPSAPSEVDEATVYIAKDYWQPIPSCSYSVSHLHIFTEIGFVDFLDGLSGLGRRWAPWFPIAAIEKQLKK
jgi:hypothetical protein